MALVHFEREMSVLRLTWLFAVLVLFSSAAFAKPAYAEWRRAESAHFVIYGEVSERELRGYAAKLEAYDYMLRDRMGLPTDAPVLRKLPIYLVNPAGLNLVMPRATRENLAGFYSASDEDIFAIVLRSGSEDVLQHEYFHHFMMQNFSAAYPAWLVEGFAEYYSTAQVRGDEIEVGRPDRNTMMYLSQAEWLDLRDLTGKPYSEVDRLYRGTYYPLSWLMTHWLLSDPARNEQLVAYMRAVGQGGDPSTSLTDVTGMTFTQLERALATHMRTGLPFVRLTYDLPAPEVTVSVLPNDVGEVLLTNQRLKLGQPQAEREEALALAQRLAARYPASSAARLMLAHAELHFGQAAEGERLLDALIADEPNNVEALQFKAGALLNRADEATDPATAANLRREAAGVIVRAYQLNPRDYASVALLARRREHEPGYPTSNDIDAWIMAVRLAPQISNVRLGAAQALMAANRQREAIVLLRPVAAAPHGGRRAELASQMMAAAERGETHFVVPEDSGEPDEGDEGGV